jgi:predicted metal-dependent phosphotriesterase family hydrolase
LNFCTPHNPVIKPNEIAEEVRQIGCTQCIMATDMGQLDSFVPTEGMRVFIRLMLDRGFTETEIRIMTTNNPAKLLNL